MPRSRALAEVVPIPLLAMAEKVLGEKAVKVSITEKKRGELQAALEEHFGVEAGRQFCWDGTGVVVSVYDARALGPYIQ